MTTDSRDLGTARKMVLAAAAALFAVWLGTHFSRLSSDQNGLLRFALGGLYALLILLRPKPAGGERHPPGWLAPWLAGLGTLLAVNAIIFDVNQFEWLGLLLLLYAALLWALPPRFRRDAGLALLLVYWVHPLPGQIFGPLEYLMQRMSVIGTERLLHAINFHVWGDGLVLRTGFRNFLVPEECSGMKTAVTVLLCSLGTGVLLRLRGIETITLIAVGLVQVLLLNILRIFVTVRVGVNMSPEWASNFLHSTVTIFLLIAVVGVHLEASAWRAWRRRRGQRDAVLARVEKEKKQMRVPPFWRVVFAWTPRVLPVLVIAAAAAFLVYKSRPVHRSHMISAMLDGLILTDPATAERAVEAALRLTPGEPNLLTARVRALLQRRRHQQALEELRRMPEGARGIYQRVLEAQALVGLGRTPEAYFVVESLPPESKNWPIVAMLMAELAATTDQPESAAENVVKASRDIRLADRVRALFRYLAMRQQWTAIRQADPPLPYREPLHAVIVIAAHLRQNDLEKAATILRQSINSWPNNPLFIHPILTLAVLQRGQGWDDLFAKDFVANISWPDVNDLTKFMEAAFALHRPDLGWLAYRRIQALAPEDPALDWAAAHFGRAWLTLRKHTCGLRATGAEETIRLDGFFRLTRDAAPWRGLWSRVPLAEEMATDVPEEVERRHVQRCLDGLRRMEQAGELPTRLQMMYPAVLEMAGAPREAHEKLNELEKRYPEKRREFVLTHVDLYERQGDWPRAYENLREADRIAGRPSLVSGLRMINCLLHFGMGVYAMNVAERLQRDFPDSDRVKVAMAAIWDFYGFKEEALFLLSQTREGPQNPVMARLLFETERFKEAQRVARSLGITDLPTTEGIQQAGYLPAAEWTISWRGGAALTDKDCDKGYESLKPVVGQSGSRFLRELAALRMNWFRVRGGGDVSDPARWVACGQNPEEQAEALYELVMLEAGRNRMASARNVADQAVAVCPHSTVLRRIQIALSKGDADIVRQSREASPADPEIWLAYLAATARDEGPGAWAMAEVRKATSENACSPGTMVRAGHFLLSHGMTNAACEAARYASRTGRGFLPADVLALRCAVATGDRKWMLSSAMDGAEDALEPWPFYKTIVALKNIEGAMDPDTLRAIEALAVRYPDEKYWAERLGSLYFQRGETERALEVLDAVLQRGTVSVAAPTMIIAAEAARLEGKLGKAVRILESAHSMYPDNASVLNNLIYCLAQDTRTLPRARELVDKLLRISGSSFAALDTAAVVYLRSGEVAKAEELMNRALKLAGKNDYAWAELNLNAAEIQIALGRYEQAQRSLKLLRAEQVSALVDSRAKEMLADIEGAIRSSYERRR